MSIVQKNLFILFLFNEYSYMLLVMQNLDFL